MAPSSLVQLYPLGWVDPPPGQYKVFSQQETLLGSCSPDDNGDEMLHWDGDLVVWSGGLSARHVRKSFRQSQPVGQALFCHFTGLTQEGIAGPPSLCVLQGQERVKVYAPDGGEFDVVLPCKAAKMWALPQGLLIERAVCPSSVAWASSEGFSPIYFTLRHPLEELKPVSKTSRQCSIKRDQNSDRHDSPSFASPIASNDNRPADTITDDFMCEPHERILLCSVELRLVVTFNNQSTHHSIWALLPNTLNHQHPSLGSRSVDSVEDDLGATFETTPCSGKDFAKRSSGDCIDNPLFASNSMLCGTPGANKTFSTQSDGSEDDRRIESELFMELVWSEGPRREQDTSSADPADAFIAHDESGQPLVCLFSSNTQQLRMYNISSCGAAAYLEVASTGVVVSAIAAQPVAGTGGRNMVHTGMPFAILVLTLEHQLELRRGSMVLFKCILPDLSSLPSRSSPCYVPSGALDLSAVSESSSVNLSTCVGNTTVLSPTSQSSLDHDGCVTGNGEHRENDDNVDIVGLRDAAVGRVTVELSNGRLLRISLPLSLAPIHSALLRRCFGILDLALPSEFVLALHSDVAACYSALLRYSILGSLKPARKGGFNFCESNRGVLNSEEKAMAQVAARLVEEVICSAGPSDIGGQDGDLAWVAFIFTLSRALFALGDQSKVSNPSNTIGRGNHNAAVADGTQTSSSQGSSSCWTELLHCGYHLSYSQQHAKMLRGLDCLAPLPSKSKVESTAGHVWWHGIENTCCSLSLIKSKSIFHAQLPLLLHCLHSLYEDCKLSSLCYPELRRLATLLSGLVATFAAPASAQAYLHHYIRDLGTVTPLSLPMVASSLSVLQVPPPTDVLQWLMAHIRPSLSEAYSACPTAPGCTLTQQLCCFYDLLSGGSGDCATVGGDDPGPNFAAWLKCNGYQVHTCADRVVLGMVWWGFKGSDLERVPFGVALALREALHACRDTVSSPGRWPADAYVLIGREDIAALVLAPTPHSMLRVEIRRKNSRRRKTQCGSPRPSTPTLLGTPAATTPIVLSPVNIQNSSATGGDQHSVTGGIGRTLGFATPTGFAQLGQPIWGGPTSITQVTPLWRRHSPNTARLNSHSIVSAAVTATAAASPFTAEMSPSAPGAAKRHDGMRGSNGTKLLSLADFASVAMATPSCDTHSSDRVSESTLNKSDNDQSGFAQLMRAASQRFGRDRRLGEVCRLLRSSSPVRLFVERKPETSDHDLVKAQQAKLLLLCRRTMALPVGRGMLTISTVRPLLTEALQIPLLSLTGRIPPNNANISLDLNAVSNGTLLPLWPSFHNGVAAGLRLAPGRTPLTRTWIGFNKPSESVGPNNTHAGLLLALGLQGHLGALTMADTYDYLAAGHDTTTVAILLGHSAASRGTSDPTISKMLCLHIPSLLPPAFAELEVPAVVETAAIMGVGLLYQGTAHRLMTEFLLAEIGRRPVSDNCADRESYSLAAGLALGFVTLGHGATPSGLAGLADLRLEDRLHRYMVGGKEINSDSTAGSATVEAGPASSTSSSDTSKCSRVREGPQVNTAVTAAGATLALGLMFLKSGNETVAARLSLPDTLFLLDYVRPDLLMLRVWARGLVLWDSVEPSSEWLANQVPPVVREAFARLSAGVTAGRECETPVDVMEEDEYANYESKDERTQAEEKHLGENHDANMSSSAKVNQNSSVIDEESVRQAHAYITGGACLALGMRFAGTALRPARDTLLKAVAHFENLRVGVRSDEYAAQRPDTCTLEMSLAAAVLAVSVVMAGTGDLTTLRVLRRLRRRVGNYSEDGIGYGQHMAIGMATGLLFLGGGRASLSDSDEALAALVVALYPRFPSSTMDNQYHMQALRHLYVLAVEKRCLDVYDVDSRSSCFVPVELSLRPDALALRNPTDSSYVSVDESENAVEDGIPSIKACAPKNKYFTSYLHQRSCSSVVRMVAPCLLPPLRWIRSIRVVSPRYWPLSVTLVEDESNESKSSSRGDATAHRTALFAYKVLCVKRKTGQLPYASDPQGLSSLLARPRPECLTDGLPELFRAFTEDQQLLAFAQHFCTRSGCDNPDDTEFTEFCASALYECLTHDKPEMLYTLLELFQAVRTLRVAQHSLGVRNLQFATAFYAGSVSNSLRKMSSGRRLATSSTDSKKYPEAGFNPLIPLGFLASLKRRLELAFELELSFKPAAAEYLRTGALPTEEALHVLAGKGGISVDGEVSLRAAFAGYLQYRELPTPSIIAEALSRLGGGCNLVSLLQTMSLPQAVLALDGLMLPETVLRVAMLGHSKSVP